MINGRFYLGGKISTWNVLCLYFTNENKFSYFAGLLDRLPGSDRQRGEMVRLENGTEAPLYRIQRRGRVMGHCVLGREGVVLTQWARVRTSDPEGKASVLRCTAWKYASLMNFGKY